MHVFVGRFLAEDFPVVLRALEQHRVTIVGILVSNFFERYVEDPPDVILLGEHVRFFVPQVRQSIAATGYGAIPIFAGRPTVTAQQRSELQMSGFDDVVDVGMSPHSICEELESLVSRHRAGGEKVDNRHQSACEIDYRDETDKLITELVAVGRTDREISDNLFLAEHTIRNRLSRLMARSGIQNRTELALVFHQKMTHDLMRRLDSLEYE